MTFDSDFFDLSIIMGHPSKIILIRAGNTTTKNLEKLIRHNVELINDFVKSEDKKDLSCLEIYEE